jgi:hypothetical protein
MHHSNRGLDRKPSGGFSVLLVDGVVSNKSLMGAYSSGKLVLVYSAATTRSDLIVGRDISGPCQIWRCVTAKEESLHIHYPCRSPLIAFEPLPRAGRDASTVLAVDEYSSAAANLKPLEVSPCGASMLGPNAFGPTVPEPVSCLQLGSTDLGHDAKCQGYLADFGTKRRVSHIVCE